MTEAKYQRFMTSISAVMQSVKLVDSALEGIPLGEISQAEDTIGKKIPLALRVWYQWAGRYSGKINMHDMDFTIRDLLHTQTIHRMMNDPACQWRISPVTLPFSSHIGEQMLLVWLDMGDDPPVYRYDEGEAYPVQESISFSSYIRDRIIGFIDGALYSLTESKRDKILQKANSSFQTMLQVSSAFWLQTEKLNKELIEQIHTEDVARGEITTPEMFQDRFVEKLAQTDLAQQALDSGVWLRRNWVFPQDNVYTIYEEHKATFWK